MSIENINSQIADLNDGIEAKLAEMEAEGTTEERAAEIEAEVRADFAKIEKLKTRAADYARVAEERARLTAADPRRPTEERSARITPVATSDAEERATNFLRVAGTREVEFRAPQSVGTNTAGGHTVATPTLITKVIETLKFAGPMADPSVVTEYVTDRGEQMKFITDDDTANSASAVAEAASMGSAELAVGEKLLGAYKRATGVVKITHELLTDSSIDIVSHVADRLGKRMSRKVNTDLTTGDGSGDPTGIITALGTPALETAAANAIAYADLIDLIHSVDYEYRKGGNNAFMMHDAQVARLRKLADSNGLPIWQDSNIQSGAPARLLGYPVLVNNAMVSTVADDVVPIIFGDFKAYAFRRVGVVQVQRFDELYAADGQVGFNLWLRYDGNLLSTGAVKGLKIKPAA
ncbi:phage major capsid protein [Phenylobacterium terrae]|uniref:Phage major capsid protein n=1 Tax=Phenylobacterium terrae TaxID=2665495 RepID=A0ABW4N6R3_9CAUL